MAWMQGGSIKAPNEGPYSTQGQYEANIDYITALQKAQLSAINNAGAQTWTPFGWKNVPGGGKSGGGKTYTPPSTTQILPPPPAVGGVPVPVGGGSTTAGNLQSASEQLRYDPWAEHRDDAGNILAGQMGDASPSNFYQSQLQQMATGQFSPQDPSYKWRFDQGQKAVERSLAAKGLLNSGNAAIELQQYGQGAASQEYGAQFDRLLKGMAGVEGAYDAQMQRLMKMAGVDLDPTAGGKLNVAQGELGVRQAGLGLEAQDIANRYDLGRRDLDLRGQQLEKMSAGGASFSPIFGPSGGASPSYQPVSWDAYFAAKDAANSAGNFIGFDSGGSALFKD